MKEEDLRDILYTMFRILENGGVPEYLVESKYGKDAVISLISEGYVVRENGVLILTEKGEDVIMDMRLSQGL